MTNTTPTPGAIDLDKLEALARAATPGPWFGQTVAGYRGGMFDIRASFQRGVASGIGNSDDAAYIAAANPAAMLDLITLARRAAQPSADKAAEGELEAFGAAMKRAWNTRDEQIESLWNDVYGQFWRDAIAASRRAAEGEPIYQVQFISETGSSAWHDASKDAYDTFMPERRRIVYSAPAPESAAQAGQVDGDALYAAWRKVGADVAGPNFSDFAAALAIPKRAAAPADWQECDRIASLPTVDEALQGFSDDPTYDNGICVVSAVLAATQQPSAQGSEA